MTEFLGTRDAAEVLGLSRFQVLRLVRSGYLPADRTGRGFQVRSADVERLLASGTDTSALRRAFHQALDRGVLLACEALVKIPLDVEPMLALARANLEGAGSLSRAEDLTTQEALGAVLAVPQEQGMSILVDFYGERLRPALADAFARREGRAAPTLLDFAAADFELPWLTEWATRSQATGFRRMTIDILRRIATDWDVAPPRAR